MKHIFYKGKKLEHIDDITNVIDEQGKAKCDLFNSKGALLSIEGKIPREKIFHRAVYTYQDVYQEFHLLRKTDETQNESPDKTLEEKLQNIKKEQLEQKVGPKIIETFNEASKIVKEVVDGKPITDKKLKTADELITETLKQDRMKLHTCITELRTIDSYTYNHSFSVSLLMAQALEDFRPYQYKDEYWNVFKTFSGKVNLSKSGLKRYCVGALLHDYGKTLIPKEILNKPTPLTPEEFEILRKHPYLGTEALREAKVDDPQILEIVGNHHVEYLTYKDRGQSTLALICNIIDIYDACRSRRVYKEPYPLKRVLEILNYKCKKYKWNHFIFDIVVNQTIMKFEASRENEI